MEPLLSLQASGRGGWRAAGRGLLRRHGTLRGWLGIANLALVTLLGSATWTGYATVERLTGQLTHQLEEVRRTAAFAANLQLSVRQLVEAGDVAARTGAAESREAYARQAARMDTLAARLAEGVVLLPGEAAALARIQALRAPVESGFAAALAAREAGLGPEAAAIADSLAAPIAALTNAARDFGAYANQRLFTATSDLQLRGAQGQRWLIIVFAASVLLAMVLLLAATESVSRPLRTIRTAAKRISKGDLRVHMDEPMLREYQALAGTFNTMVERLRDFVHATESISAHIATSAHELSTISEEVATSSGEVANAMTEITRGAQGQSQGIVETSAALEEMRRRGGRIDEAAHRVVELSEEIRELAESHRVQMADAVRLVFEVRGAVESSEAEARELANASIRIDRFVEMISTVARQTNLLALNAAIEAARAGEHGRGFAVVAEEVRKLADGSSEAAREVSGIVQEVRSRIHRMAETMERGAKQVRGVEGAARAAEVALEQIMGTVVGVTDATIGVNEALLSNRQALRRVEASLEEVSGAAEAHAASAQEVAAAAEQQSAATVQVSAASGELRAAAARMRDLVAGLKT